MLMRRGSGRPVVAELGRELVATSGGWVAPAACSAPVATAAADGDTELAEAVAAVYRAYTTSSWYTHGMVCSSGPCGLVNGSSVPGV